MAMTLLIEANVKFLSLADIPANILKEAPLVYCDAFIGTQRRHETEMERDVFPLIHLGGQVENG